MNLLQRVANLFGGEKRSYPSNIYDLIVGGASTYAGPRVDEESLYQRFKVK